MSTDSTSNEPTTPSVTFTSEDLSKIREALNLVGDFEIFLIRRARVYSALNYKTNRKLPSPSSLEDNSGYRIGLYKWQIHAAASSDLETMQFYYHDSRDGGPYHEFEVPRDFVFSNDTTETDYQKYLELKARFEG